MPRHSAQQKEQFSIAYLRAIDAVAGYNITSVEVDEDSIDIGLRGNRRDGTLRKAPVLDVQAKCTSTDDGHGLHLPFDLSVKNYDDLRESSRHVPLILVVVCVPPDLGDWLEETPEHTAMRRCAYERGYYELQVPRHGHWKDYTRRVRDVLAVLAEEEARSQIELVTDIPFVARDVIRVRCVVQGRTDGTLSLDDGAHIAAAARSMMLAAACSTVEPRRAWDRGSRSRPPATSTT
jgi:Domain of unknown function (DUF4365)